MCMLRFFLFFGCLVIAADIANGSESQTDRLRALVIDSVENQRVILKSGFHVRYFVHRRLLHLNGPPDFVHVSGPQCDYSGSGRIFRAEHARLDGKLYAVTTLSKSASVEEDPFLQTRVYDGERGFLVSHKRGTAQVHQSDEIGGPSKYVLPEEELYREVIGFESLRQGIGITFRGPKNPIPFDLVDVLETPRTRLSRTRQDGRALVLVEQPKSDSIWLDPGRGYAIVRREWRWGVGKPLRAVIENSEFRKCGESVWLPTTCRIRYFGRPESLPNRVVVDATLKVEHISLEPSEELFAPPLKGGMLVSNVENNFHARMPPLDEAMLQRFLEAPHETVALLNARDRAGAIDPWRAAFVLLSLLILLAAMYLLNRHYA